MSRGRTYIADRQGRVAAEVLRQVSARSHTDISRNCILMEIWQRSERAGQRTWKFPNCVEPMVSWCVDAYGCQSAQQDEIDESHDSGGSRVPATAERRVRREGSSDSRVVVVNGEIVSVRVEVSPVCRAPRDSVRLQERWSLAGERVSLAEFLVLAPWR